MLWFCLPLDDFSEIVTAAKQELTRAKFLLGESTTFSSWSSFSVRRPFFPPWMHHHHESESPSLWWSSCLPTALFGLQLLAIEENNYNSHIITLLKNLLKYSHPLSQNTSISAPYKVPLGMEMVMFGWNKGLPQFFTINRKNRVWEHCCKFK